MTRKMLIDAAHAEETRVAVLNGTRVEEFDFESQNRKQLRGNIYLAKVTRVEPSLQAAFVEYGGNRHGFLAFNEIHPDYYQIPLADREALLREAAEADDDEPPAATRDEGGEVQDAENLGGLEDEDEIDEEVARRRQRLIRRYKIQEVIKRRQIMLVQVVKEERGNKGAALTTYLSLAGRYCVLMPNTDRGGGISRKITSATDRKRLRGIVQSLDVAPGMGLIVRTAGAKRTKAEIKRDYDYLVRAWDNIRETTLHSVAPALIYEEEDLVKRAIRDLYDKDLDGIWVEGEAGFKEARDFMRMLMPAQAKKVQAYREPTPLFVRHRIEDNLSQIYSPVVPLKSGGYLVINQTEALVAVDVNSGRATRERNIEATALKTNLEAAEEACRQLRLRDLAGLIVIDFIDMEEAKNNRAVEKKLKDCLKDDRARVQMGKISSFGLMEISRQRRRSGILEGTTHTCPHCQGAGRIRSVESSALSALRALEIEALRGGGEVVIRTPKDVGLYMLNAKRDYLMRLRQTHGLWVNVALDDSVPHAEHQIERLSSEAPPARGWEQAAEPAYAQPPVVEDEEEEDFEEAEDQEELEEIEAEDAHAAETGEEDGRRRRRRRRGRRGEESRPSQAPAPSSPRDQSLHAAESGGDGDGRRRRRRGRRGGRRAREDGLGDTYGWSWPARAVGEDAYQWRGPQQVIESAANEERPAPSLAAASSAPAPSPEPQDALVDVWVELPAPETPAKRSRRTRSRMPKGSAREAAPTPANEAGVETDALMSDGPVETPEPVSASQAPAQEDSPPMAPVPPPAVVAAAPPPAPEPDPNEIVAPPEAPRRGWWRRGA